MGSSVSTLSDGCLQKEEHFHRLGNLQNLELAKKVAKYAALKNMTTKNTVRSDLSSLNLQDT